MLLQDCHVCIGRLLLLLLVGVLRCVFFRVLLLLLVLMCLVRAVLAEGLLLW